MLDSEIEHKWLNNIYHRAKWFNQKDVEIEVTWKIEDSNSNVLIGKVDKLEDHGRDKYLLLVESKSSQERSLFNFEHKSIRLNIKDIIEIKEFL